MQEENKNIQLESNGDITIGPAENMQETKDVTNEKVVASGLEVIAKPEIAEENDTFDVRIENLKKNKEEKVVEKVIKDESKTSHLFLFVRQRAGSFLEAFVATIVFVVFSAVIFAAGVFADISYSNYKSEYFNEGVVLVGDQNVLLVEGYKIDTSNKNGAALVVGKRGVLRLGADTVLVVKSIDNESKFYSFTLEKGNLWSNSVFDESSFFIETKYANIHSERSSFSVVTDDVKTNVYSDLHDVKVDLIADGKVINTLWIAQGNQAQIVHSKIENEKQKIEKLLYSKLVKEFGYGRISEKKKSEDDWLMSQLGMEISYYNSFQSDYSKKVSQRGLKMVSIESLRSQAKSILADMRSSLTFNENKKNEQSVNAIFENIEDAEYLFSQGNVVDGKIRLSLFDGDLKDMLASGDDSLNAILFEKIKQKYYELSLFVPGDEVFPVKKLMFEKLNDPMFSQFLNTNDKFVLLTSKINDVYDAVKSSPVDLNYLFSEYFELYAFYVNPYSLKLSEIKDHIIHQNILVDNLLFQTPELYKIEFFDQKKRIENDYLSSLGSSLDKKEQRQTFISNDIDLLSRVRYFLFNDKLDPSDARKIVYRLIKDIEDYQEGTVDIAAVNELFSKRLSDFGVFWEYLQATEYSSTQLHGASHSERFDAFKKIKQESLSFEEIKNEILGSVEVSERSIETIIGNSKNDLESAGIQDVEFGSYTDSSKTKIPVLSARAGGIKFRATYDWDRQILSNIVVGDKIISQEGVRLSKASKFITETMSSLTKAEEKQVVSQLPAEEKDELANVKRVAAVFLAEKFSKMGITITVENIEVLDIKSGNYYVKNVYFSDTKNVVFSFEYNTSTDKVSKLTVKTKTGEKNVGDTFSSTFMRNLVLKVYEESN